MSVEVDVDIEAANDDGWEVPEFTVRAFAPRRCKYAACVFVINEGPRIAAQLRRMRPLSDAVDLIVADGGSTDGSLAPERLQAAGVNTLLTKRGPGKLSAQMRMALAFALRRGYEGAVVIDGNDKDDPAAIPEFLRALDAGFDHVQGSRFLAGGRAINTPWSRLLALRLIHAPLISLAAGFRYTDTTNGFRAYSRRLLLDPRVAPFRTVFSRYELHYYLAIRAARLGHRVCEVPVTRAYPAGKVPTKISKFRGNLLVLATLFRACLGQYSPDGCESAAMAKESSDGQRPDRTHRLRGREPRASARL
jgi:glycosyltransferase involved in cell wall biosynthesis